MTHSEFHEWLMDNTNSTWVALADGTYMDALTSPAYRGEVEELVADKDCEVLVRNTHLQFPVIYVLYHPAKNI